MTFPDGRKYVGELKDGKAQGYGILYASDGSIKYEGEFNDGTTAAWAEVKDLIEEQSKSAPTPTPAPVSTTTQAPANKPTMTKAEFDQLKSGMTYEEATAIIGGPGEVLSESGNAGDEYHTVMYQYKGEGGFGANANLMFQGNKLMNKAQMGLK
ncbi:MAG: DUF3862 domain-containing protein [Clostridiales bacterium]|nr:DUF3862 domain-containing protein [Clostridiales bacterium]